MSTTISTLTSFSASSLTTPRVWHLDVPLTYPTPPIGHRLTLALATSQPLPPLACDSQALILAFAGGLPVWAAELVYDDAPASLPMLLTPNSAPAVPRIHLTAAIVRVIDVPLDALCQPSQEALANALADLSKASDGYGPGVFGAATELTEPIAAEVLTLLFPASKDPALAVEQATERPAAPPTLPPINHNYWALAVPHNFCPPAAFSKLTVFAMTVNHHSPIYPGDLVFAFARGRLSMAARVTCSTMPPELQVSVEISPNPTDSRGYITTAEVEILPVDTDDLYGCDETFLLDELGAYVDTLLKRQYDLSWGDARPFKYMLGDLIADRLSLTQSA